MQPYNIFRETLQFTKHSFTFNSYSDLSKPDTIRFVMVDNSLGYSRILMDRILPIVFKASATFSINQELGVIQSEVKNHKTSISELDSRITKNTNSISTIKQRADSIESTVSSHTDTINNITGTVTKVQDDISSIKQTAENIESRVTSNEQTIDDITGKVKNNTEKISSINQRADSIESSVKSMEKRIDNISGNTQITEDMSSLKQRADSIEATVKSHTETISGLDGRVTTNTDNISKIKQTADSISSTVESLGDTYVSKSELKQKSDEILAQVNNTYIKIGDDNITLGGNTTVKGSLTLTQTDQGFKLVGPDGITEIMPKSVGAYDDFKAANTSKQNVVKSTNCNGAQSISDGILRFEGGIIIYLGDRKKGDFIKVKFNTFSSRVTNGWTGSSFTNSFDISTSFSAKVMNQYNSAVLHNWNTVYAGSEYSYTFDSDTPNARIYVSFKGNTLYSTWVGNYDVMQGGKPMPMPNAHIQLTCTVTLPTAAHMLIGYDGWGVNFGNNKTVYCGKDGLIANFGNNEFRITSDGIWNNSKKNVMVLNGTGYSNSAPNTYTVVLPIDTVLCKGDNCKVVFPKDPPEGYVLTIFDKCLDKCFIHSNGKKVQGTTDYGTDFSNPTNDELSGRIPWRWTFIDNTWYAEYIG